MSMRIKKSTVDDVKARFDEKIAEREKKQKDIDFQVPLPSSAPDKSEWRWARWEF